MSDPIISHFQAKVILKAIQEKKDRVVVSLDLGVSSTPLPIFGQEVEYPNGVRLGIKQLKKVLKHGNKCYFITKEGLSPINVFSEETGWMRTLYPTASAPTTLVSGFLMHRIKDIDPKEGAKGMVSALGKIRDGVILDTSMGLGYTAIELGKVGKVISVEIDPAAIELAKLNPYSTPLFSDPNIEVVVGDIREVIGRFGEGTFTHILHDPPTFKLAGELYSLEFYKELFRVLKNGGVLFHYIGDPDSALGAQVTKGVIERLKEAGFRNVEKKPRAFGVIAVK